jgi:LuxR family maltose regulon positive regulatory protein
MKLQTEGFRDAMSLVSQGEAMASRRSLPRFSRLLKIFELDVAVRSGREAEARRLSGSVKLLLRETADAKGFRWRSRLLARLGLTQFESQFGDPETAFDLFLTLTRDCRRWGLRRYELRALVLHMIASVARGDTSGAATILRDALALGQRHNMQGAFIREGDRFGQAARTIVRERGVAGFSQDALSFLAKLLSRVKDTDDTENILSEILTKKEFLVLSSLSEGNANKVIARALDLSEPTVKFHLQNVYSKLGVNSRKLAIELASHYGLCSAQEP